MVQSLDVHARAHLLAIASHRTRLVSSSSPAIARFGCSVRSARSRLLVRYVDGSSRLRSRASSGAQSPAMSPFLPERALILVRSTAGMSLASSRRSNDRIRQPTACRFARESRTWHPPAAFQAACCSIAWRWLNCPLMRLRAPISPANDCAYGLESTRPPASATRASRRSAISSRIRAYRSF